MQKAAFLAIKRRKRDRVPNVGVMGRFEMEAAIA